MSYACTSVSKQDLGPGEREPIDCKTLTFDGTFDGQLTDGTLEFKPTEADYLSQKYPPGLYDIVITGTEDQALVPESLSVTITMELIDPCAAATVSIREAGLAPQEYSITNRDATYRPSPIFRENQGICETEITATEATLLPSGVRRLQAGSDPLTFDEST